MWKKQKRLFGFGWITSIWNWAMGMFKGIFTYIFSFLSCPKPEEANNKKPDEYEFPDLGIDSPKDNEEGDYGDFLSWLDS